MKQAGRKDEVSKEGQRGKWRKQDGRKNEGYRKGKWMKQDGRKDEGRKERGENGENRIEGRMKKVDETGWKEG